MGTTPSQKSTALQKKETGQESSASKVFIKKLSFENFLSFEETSIELGSLNVCVGPNASGKSNLLDAVLILSSLPKNLGQTIDSLGSVKELVWKGSYQKSANGINILAEFDGFSRFSGETSLLYAICFIETNFGWFISNEWLSDLSQVAENGDVFKNMLVQRGAEKYDATGVRQNLSAKTKPAMGFKLERHKSEIKDQPVDEKSSALSELKDAVNYPEITWLSKELHSVCFFKDWPFGRNAPYRRPQLPDQDNRRLAPDASNLGLVLSRLKRDAKTKKKFIQAMQQLYAGIDDFEVSVGENAVQIVLHEGDFTIPANRLSDGTLRYMALLAILLDPKPPPLVCIEEPEMGLHPDILPGIAELLKDASTRMQLIVTTHSDILIDAFSDTPESVLVFEKHDGRTTVKRLEKDKLQGWLKDYRLGEFWLKGGIGGTRW